MVRLDDHGHAVDLGRLHHVGIYRALRQPLHVAYALRLLVEYLHEVAADDLALGLGVGYAGQIAEELVVRLDSLDVEAHALV